MTTFADCTLSVLLSLPPRTSREQTQVSWMSLQVAGLDAVYKS